MAFFYLVFFFKTWYLRRYDVKMLFQVRTGSFNLNSPIFKIFLKLGNFSSIYEFLTWGGSKKIFFQNFFFQNLLFWGSVEDDKKSLYMGLHLCMRYLLEQTLPSEISGPEEISSWRLVILVVFDHFFNRKIVQKFLQNENKNWKKIKSQYVFKTYFGLR